MYDEAVRDFTTAIELYSHPAYHYYRALSLEALGRRNEAAKDLSRAGGFAGPLEWYWEKRETGE
jgi:tetratricopeptide (TPR) repeat protein